MVTQLLLFALLFIIYATIPPVALYYRQKSIFQTHDPQGWHLLYAAKFFIALSFLPLLMFPQLNLGIVPQSLLSIVWLPVTLVSAIVGISFARKKHVLQFYFGGVYAAFMEEVLFRGVLFALAEAIWHSTWISILVTAVAFGLWHLKNYSWYQDKKWTIRQVIYTGCFYGPLICAVRVFTGDIYLGILIHFITDAYVALAPKKLRWTIIGDKNNGEGFKDI